MVEASGQVRQSGVGNTITEGDVKPFKVSSAPLGKEADAYITDVITGAEVQVTERRKSRETLEPGVRDADAEA